MKDNKTEFMTNEALQDLISSWMPDPLDTGLEFSEEGSQFLNITVQPEQLHQLMSQLKSDSATQFDYLFCLSGVDWETSLGVVYHLESTIHRHIIVVKVQTSDREHPTFDTVSDIWKTAEFHEREVFDFFGITFNKHPNLKRLFLTEDWDGFPLRKDYVDEINMVIK
jgi:NADH/F420H2 dehydrogenase subunit C